jgi:hypothetical protein
MTIEDELQILRMENEILTNVYMTKCRVCEQLLIMIADLERRLRDANT